MNTNIIHKHTINGIDAVEYYKKIDDIRKNRCRCLSEKGVRFCKRCYILSNRAQALR